MTLQRKFTIVGSATLASRFSGFLRDALVAAVLGTSQIADAFFAAFLLPNLFRRMLGEGAFNSSFIPMFTRRDATGGSQSARAFAENALSMLIVISGTLFVLSMVFMPSIMAVLAGGFRADHQKFADAVTFARLAFPFIVSIALVALFSAVLNAVGRYALVALAPVILNVILIAVLFVLLTLGWVGSRETGITLVVSISCAGAIQLLVVLVAAIRAGYPLVPRWPEASWFLPVSAGARADADMRRFALLSLPGIALAGAGHINILVAVQIASQIPSAVSWIYYADRLFQLPLGFVATAIGIVLLPSIARHVQTGDVDGIRDMLSRSLEFALILTLPAATALFILAEPLVSVLYERGRFSGADTFAAAGTLKALALGLPGFVMVKLLLPGFLARERFTWPILFALMGVGANVAVGTLMITTYGHVAPALGVAVSAWVNALLLGAALALRGEFVLDQAAWRSLPRILLATLVTTVALVLLRPVLMPLLHPSHGLMVKGSVLMAFTVGSILLHAAAIHVLGAADVRKLKNLLQKG